MNDTEYLVFLPTMSEGIDYGYVAPMRVRAMTPKEAVHEAARRWWGGAGREGKAIVLEAKHAEAFVIGEIREVAVTARCSLPDVLAEHAA